MIYPCCYPAYYPCKKTWKLKGMILIHFKGYFKGNNKGNNRVFHKTICPGNNRGNNSAKMKLIRVKIKNCRWIRSPASSKEGGTKQPEELWTWPGFEPTNEGQQEDSSVLTTIPPRRTVGKSKFFSFYTMVQQNISSVIMCRVSFIMREKIKYIC